MTILKIVNGLSLAIDNIMDAVVALRDRGDIQLTQEEREEVRSEIEKIVERAKQRAIGDLGAVG